MPLVWDKAQVGKAGQRPRDGPGGGFTFALSAEHCKELVFLNSNLASPDTVLSPFSRVWLFATPWTVAHPAPLSMGILQARILEWVAYPPPGDLSNPEIKSKPSLPHCRQILYQLSHQGSPPLSSGRFICQDGRIDYTLFHSTGY